jgi:beta-barrel assembly-enhancing protease
MKGNLMNAIALARVLALATFALLPIAAQADDADELQMGAQLFDQLKSQGEIVASSPLYDRLRPIEQAITKVVQPKYQYPIHFYIVHEQQPNAFAAPGGNIYVVDSLFYFVKNTEELAGTICHETSHLLHHDSVAQMKRNDGIKKRAIAATVLLGPSVGTVLAATAIGQLDSLHYSRDVEESADITGSDTCAAAGYDPWGLVWLFRDFSNADLKQPPEILSDHPNDEHRVDALEAHFREHPETFARFSNDPRSAKPIQLPANEAEQFLR